MEVTDVDHNFYSATQEASSVLLKNDRSFVTTEAQIMKWAALIK